MTVFLRYFPAAETMYKVFVALSIGIILLNWGWQLFKNFDLGGGRITGTETAEGHPEGIAFGIYHACKESIVKKLSRTPKRKDRLSMADRQNDSSRAIETGASAAHAIRGAEKAGKMVSGAAKGAAAGPYGSAAGFLWENRKTVGKGWTMCGNGSSRILPLLVQTG